MPLISDELAQRLGGFAAGVQGTLPQFRQQQLQAQQVKQTQQAGARKTLIRGMGAAHSLIKGGNLQDAIQVLSEINDPNAQQFVQELTNPETFQEALGDLNGFVLRAQATGDLTTPDAPKQQIVDGQVVTFGDKPTATPIEGFQAAEGQGGAEQQFFESLIEGLPKKEQKKAIAIKLGLKGRAVSNAVLSAIASGDIGNLSDAKAQIRQAEKFAELTGVSRAKAIDKGVDRILKIDSGIKNIDRAIVAVRAGAGVGAIEKNFPSLKAASVELDNIQKSMALDVIGAVTFGALSKGELDLAKEVALPTGLNSDELIQHLQNRKAAQEKLRAYFNEQIQFLDKGGTVAGFLRQKEREQGQPPTDQQAGQQRNVTVDF
jgi:hypothetical protein